jgi:sulfur transfer protein SufE
MKTLFKNQENFIETINEFNEWNEKFNYLMALNDMLSKECPPELIPFRIATCQSRTYFRAWKEDGWMRVNGWSNTPVQRGIIVSMIEMFDRVPMYEFVVESDIYFHKSSGLSDHLTPFRREGLKEMIKRIYVLYKDTK